jgi:site-specific DNA recombinase
MVVKINETPDYDDEADVYVRVSSEDQQERETIENQIEFATKYCDLHRIKIREWYKDDGVSGTLPFESRPDGKRMLEDAKAGRVKTVLVFNLKRFSRNARITLNAVYALEQYGVQIKSMTEPFDTTTAHGRFALTILAGVAEYDRETTLETMWHGANRAARKGKWLGGIVPYGYRVNEERFLEICEDALPGREEFTEAGIVRMIYHLIASQKWTTIKVADYFNALTIPTLYVRDGRKVKKGKRKEKTAGIWTPSRIGTMVKNSTYKGLHIYGRRTKKDRELIERIVPAIVSSEVWDTAQEVIRSNQLEATKNSVRYYLLRGLIKCGSCGRTYHGTSFSGTKRAAQAYYICGGKNAYKGPMQPKCLSKNIRADYVEELVWNECVNFLRNPKDTLQELASGMEVKIEQKHTLISEREITVRSLKDKDNEKQVILDLFRKRMIESSDVEQQLQSIAQEKLFLEQRIRELDNLIDSEVAIEHRSNAAESLLTELKEKLDDNPSFEVKREIVLALVREILIDSTAPGNDADSEGTRTKRISIKIKYSFDYVKVVPRTPVRAGITEGAWTIVPAHARRRP